MSRGQDEILRYACMESERDRVVCRFLWCVADELWPDLRSIEEDGAAYWTQVAKRWREVTGQDVPWYDPEWARLAHRLGIDPPEGIDDLWTHGTLLPALLATLDGPISPMRSKSPGACVPPGRRPKYTRMLNGGCDRGDSSLEHDLDEEDLQILQAVRDLKRPTRERIAAHIDGDTSGAFNKRVQSLCQRGYLIPGARGRGSKGYKLSDKSIAVMGNGNGAQMEPQERHQ